MTARDAEMVAAIAAIEEDEAGVVAPVPPASRPAQVYSVRIPVDRIDQLRSVAASEGTTPSTLIRAWVVDRLDRTSTRNNVVMIRGPRIADTQASSRSDLERARTAALRAV